MRGHTTLFANVFPSSVGTEAEQKGKRNVMISRRDNALASRYFYYAQIQRKRYDDCLLSLEDEFFITASVIVQRLTLKQAFIKELVAKENAVALLKKEYPHFSW